MPTCPSCGFVNAKNEMRCPECGSFYSKVIELIDQQAAEEELQSFRGQVKRILSSGNVKQALLAEWHKFKGALTPQAKFSLLVIFVFVFALIISVL
jgi:predicted ATP-dependent serine protease